MVSGEWSGGVCAGPRGVWTANGCGYASRGGSSGGCSRGVGAARVKDSTKAGSPSAAEVGGQGGGGGVWGYHLASRLPVDIAEIEELGLLNELGLRCVVLESGDSPLLVDPPMFPQFVCL